MVLYLITTVYSITNYHGCGMVCYWYMYVYVCGRDVKRLGGGMLMTEFGAAQDIIGDIYALNKLVDVMDEFSQSWMYWQFKYVPSSLAVYTD